MAQSETQMWTYRSNVLDGHYVSQVIVQGRDKAEAVANAVSAVEDYLEEQFSLFQGLGTCSVRITREGPKGPYDDFIFLDPSEEDFEDNKISAMASALAEAEALIQPVENGRMVVYRNG